MKVSLSREDGLCRSKWSVGVDQIASGLRLIQPLLLGDTTGFETSVFLLLLLKFYRRKSWLYPQ